MAIGVCLVIIVLLFQVKLFIFSCGVVFLPSSLLCMHQNSLGLFAIYIMPTLRLVWITVLFASIYYFYPFM